MHIMYDRPTLQAFFDRFNFLAPKVARIVTFFICSIDSHGQGGSIEHKKSNLMVLVFLLETETSQNDVICRTMILGRSSLKQKNERYEI